MSSHHRYAYAALALVYGATAAIFALESAFAHAACALAATAVYAALCRHLSGGSDQGKES